MAESTENCCTRRLCQLSGTWDPDPMVQLYPDVQNICMPQIPSAGRKMSGIDPFRKVTIDGKIMIKIDSVCGQ